MKTVVRVLASLLVLGFAPGSFGSIIEDVYRQHRSWILNEGVFSAEEHVFAVGRARSVTGVLDDQRAYKKARLLAKGNLGYLAYDDVDWPSHLSGKTQQVLMTAHLRVRPQQYIVSGLTILDEFLDSDRRYVAVVGAERERLGLEKMTFAGIKRDLIDLSDANPGDCRLSMIRLEIMSRGGFEASINSMGRCFSNQIHPNFQAIFHMDVNSMRGNQRLDMEAFSNKQIRNLSQDALLKLYAIQPFNARVAYWVGERLEDNGYSRAADFIHHTGTIAGQGGEYVRLNRKSLSDDDEFVQYLNERMMETQ